MFLSLTVLMLPLTVECKGASQFLKAVREIYPNAKESRQFETAAEDFDVSKVRSFVVLNQGGIPAERAAYFINWGEYDYRGSTVNLEDGSITTRRGAVYTYLQKGDVLCIVDVTAIGRKLYFKMITPEPYIPSNRIKEKRHSRVTLTLMFLIPKEFREKGDTKAVLDALSNWMVPFKTLDDARSYAAKLLNDRDSTFQGGNSSNTSHKSTSGQDNPSSNNDSTVEKRYQLFKRTRFK